jgi:hypothetical protein
VDDEKDTLAEKRQARAKAQKRRRALDLASKEADPEARQAILVKAGIIPAPTVAAVKPGAPEAKPAEAAKPPEPPPPPIDFGAMASALVMTVDGLATRNIGPSMALADAEKTALAEALGPVLALYMPANAGGPEGTLLLVTAMIYGPRLVPLVGERLFGKAPAK